MYTVDLRDLFDKDYDYYNDRKEVSTIKNFFEFVAFSPLFVFNEPLMKCIMCRYFTGSESEPNRYHGSNISSTRQSNAF